jgi:hypothetical protein
MSSARQGWQGTVRVPTEERPSPNKQVPYVTAHVRVYWPGNATDAQVVEAITDAYDQAVTEALAVRRRPSGSTP